MKRIVLTFGLIGGAVVAVPMYTQMSFIDRIGFDRAEILGYATMVLAFLMVFFGIRSYRDNVAGGSIGFGRAFKVGLLITLVICACYVLSWEVAYFGFGFFNDFLDRYFAHALEQARASGATQAQLAEQAAEAARMKELYRNPLVNAGMTLLEILPVGLIMTLVCAGILGRGQRGASVEAQAA